MFHAELISTVQLDSRFHTFAGQLIGVNTASVVQNGKRPLSEHALALAYYKAFSDTDADTSDVKALLGMLHFGMLCAAQELDMAEVAGYPHGLRCLQSKPNRGVLGAIFTGDGEQWASAVCNAGQFEGPVREWGMTCYRQFCKYDLSDLFNRYKPDEDGRSLIKR